MAKRKQKKKKGSVLFWSLAVTLLTAALLIFALMILDGRHTEIVMLGEKTVTLEYGHSYQDPGVELRTVGRLRPEPWKVETVHAVNEIDNKQLGRQKLEYVFAVRGQEREAVRYVTVVDTVPPEITLQPYAEGMEPSWMRGYVEPGYSASDNVDGDLSAIVETTMLDDRVVYTVTDSSGNERVAERLLGNNMAPPEIELNEGSLLTFSSRMSWEDPGFSAHDALGNDLSEYVQVEGEVTPYLSGEYELRYTIENMGGDTVTALRHVTVEPIKQSDTVYPDKKTIYLTFDDGPGPYTSRLLDVLARHNVKATFFVTGNQKDYADCIGRAHREGHSVGVHSYTHNYWNIYASEEAYFEDFNACEALIYEQTGSYTNIFRFPGGSSNTVSRFNPGIMSRLAEEMTDMGYAYFDWNVTSGDAGETTDTDEVYYNVINSCTSNVSVVLQHDIKGFSVDAVERIIIWGLSNGYQFLPLDASCYGAHHRINN